MPLTVTPALRPRTLPRRMGPCLLTVDYAGIRAEQSRLTAEGGAGRRYTWLLAMEPWGTAQCSTQVFRRLATELDGRTAQDAQVPVAREGKAGNQDWGRTRRGCGEQWHDAGNTAVPRCPPGVEDLRGAWDDCPI